MKKGVPMFSFFLIACYCYCGKQRRQTIRVSLVHISPRLYQSPHRHMEVLRALVQAVADVNKANTAGTTPLFAAATNGRDEVVRALVEAGADVTQAANDGRTAGTVAADHGHAEVVQVLGKAGA